MRDENSHAPGEVDVAIVGAGPVGLAAAIELGRRGVRCLLVERNDRVGNAPRAKTTNVRTRTHLRRWGIAGRLAERAPFGTGYPSDVHFVTRLAGHRLAVFENAFNARPERHPDYPEHAQWIPQYALEEVLRSQVSTLDTVTELFRTEFTGLLERENGVKVTLRDTESGQHRTVTTRYLLGADGARSAVRQAIGATMHGRQGLSQNYNIVFRAPGLAEAHGHGPGIMFWQVNGDIPSVIGPMDRDDIWYFVPTGIPDARQLSEREASALIARATGIDGDYRILSSDRWTASRLIADRYRDGRTFLIGDACHLHPPFGGYGMNMGIGDSVDLGWKIAAVLQGWGGEQLLASYEAERRPVHEWIMDEAEANHALLGNQLWREGLDDDTPEGHGRRNELGEEILKAKEREFRTLGAVLGYCYEDSPVLASEAGGEPRDARYYQASSRPGCLAPHLWLDDGSSLYDHFGDGFTLLVRGSDPFEAIAGAAALRIPLAIVHLRETARDRYPRRLTLVRPDQHVAWRGDRWVPGILSTAAGLARHRPPSLGREAQIIPGAVNS